MEKKIYCQEMGRNGEANLLCRDGTKWLKRTERTERQGRQYLGKNRETRMGGSGRKQYLRAQEKTKAKAEPS